MKRTEMKPGAKGLNRSPIGAGTAGLKRTAIAASSTPLARSAIKPGAAQLTRSSPMVWTPIARAAKSALSPPPRQRALRSRRARLTPIQRSARDEDCTFNIPGICQNKTDTTVWCHSNSHADGKGMGIKASDQAGCYGCSACHAFYDGGWAAVPSMTRELAHQYFETARAKSRLKLQQKGLVE